MNELLADREQALVDEFTALDQWEDRYRRIIELGRQLPELPSELKTERQRVRGCQSQVWLHAELDDQQRVVFRADSDALIVKGLIAILLGIYSAATPAEILSFPPNFVKRLGLEQHLSPTRSNGLRAMLEQMFYYAKAFQTLLKVRNPA